MKEVFVDLKINGAGKSAAVNGVKPSVEYYDLKRHWRKVRRHIEHPEVQALLVRDFNKFTYGRWCKKFEPGMVPHQFESCDWWCNHRGRLPAFWSYTKHSACHWLVGFTLRLAQLVEPKRQWRIITSSKHSTVWDGERLLFDFNFQAMGVSPEECFALAYKKELKPGELLQVHLAEHWTKERNETTNRRTYQPPASAIRSVEQIPEQERPQLSSASLQVRPNTKHRRQFARLRQKLQRQGGTK